jgi:hypothetical protein
MINGRNLQDKHRGQSGDAHQSTASNALDAGEVDDPKRLKFFTLVVLSSQYIAIMIKHGNLILIAQVELKGVKITSLVIDVARWLPLLL